MGGEEDQGPGELEGRPEGDGDEEGVVRCEEAKGSGENAGWVCGRGDRGREDEGREVWWVR